MVSRATFLLCSQFINVFFSYLGTYEEIQRVSQSTDPPEDLLYDTIADDQKPSLDSKSTNVFQGVEMRKPKALGHLKGLVTNESKVRVSMYGLIGYDCESDESEEDILVSDPPLKVFVH